MTTRFRSVAVWLLLGVCALAMAAAASYRYWLPAARQYIGRSSPENRQDVGHTYAGGAGEVHTHDATAPLPSHHDQAQRQGNGSGDLNARHARDASDDDGHSHDAEPDDHEHDEAASLRLSKQAEASVGLRLCRVELSPFARTISVPATVVQRPGRSQVQVSAPFTGLVTKIYCTEGEAIAPGTPLFDLQLTHEELVEAQAEFLRLGEELDVVRREVARVAAVAAEGAIAGKTLLQRQYEQQKLEAQLHALRQRLMLHRLSPEQVDGILQDRKLLRNMTVVAPPLLEDSRDSGILQVQRLLVERGHHVEAGAPLCELADHRLLYVQGKAFEQDIPTLSAAVRDGLPVTAVFPSPDRQSRVVEGLRILYLDNEVQTLSRAFHFYVLLPNELTRDTTTEAGQRFVDWRFKPGQRLRLSVPTEAPVQRILLPVEAVVQDGAEAYVFEHNRDHFDRRNVCVEYRDQDRVVIANDGSLELGVEVAASGAYQIHLGTKNKAGAGVDPHAGHQH
ncbi:MAG: efflux RND transporter periplasmic adaptor subunit [Pirellulales bacterium]|nr:efflux RND transporter periplasmic adaptor subunit [Pirellulales bacterium]